MTVNAQSGPNINYGMVLSSSGAVNEYNEERGPGLNDLGEGTLDPRAPFCYKPGNRPGVPVFGWPGCFGGPAVDFMPIALNTSGIAPTAVPSSLSVTLATSAASSSFRLITGFIPSTVPVSNPSSINVLMIDGYQGGLAVGQGSSSPMFGVGCGFGSVANSSGAGVNPQTVNLWNPICMAGRGLSFTETVGSTSAAATITVTGYDVYGMLMHIILTGPASGATVNSLKAIKYVQSISLSSAITGSLAVGVNDTYGFPLLVDHPAYATIWVGPSSGATVSIGTSNTHTFGYGSSLYGVIPTTANGPSTGTGSGPVVAAASSLGDVRGTYASSLASTGNTGASGSTGMRVTMNISPRVNNLVTVSQNSFWGLVGVPQA